MDEYTNRKYTLNCSSEAKRIVDEYVSKTNLTQREVIDYMCTLLLEKENKSPSYNTKNDQSDIYNEIKKVEKLIKSFSEKSLEINIRTMLICTMIQGLDFDQNAVIKKGITSASEISGNIYNNIMGEMTINRQEENPKTKTIKSTLSDKEKDIFGLTPPPAGIPPLNGDNNE